MFEIGVFTDEVSQEFDVAIKLAKEFNVRNFEIRSVWERAPHLLTDDDISKIKNTIEKEDFKVVCIASPFLKCDLGDKKQYDEHIKILRRCIGIAKKLNTKIVRGFTFWKKGELKDNWAQIIDNFKEPTKIAENEGIILGIENEPACYVGVGKDLGKFLREINSKNVKAIWDPGNEIFVKDADKPFPDGYNHVKDVMVHFHIKDAVRKGPKNEPECVCVGEGEVDYKGQFQALKEDGFNGCASLETHWRIASGLTDEQMKKPGGGAYSVAGEESSRRCLKNIFTMIGGLK